MRKKIEIWESLPDSSLLKEESQIRKSIDATTAKMKEAAKNLDFLQAAQYRDEIIRLQTLLK